MCKRSATTIMILLLAGSVSAFATAINDPWAPNSSDSSEQNLYQVYNAIYGTSYTSSADIPQVSPDEIFDVLGGAASLVAEARYAALGQTFGYYQPTDNSGPVAYTQVFDVQDPNSGYPLIGFSQVISPVGAFGFYDLSGGTYWHSQAALNTNQEDHMITFSTANPYVFLLAFEDLPFALSDQDYNDLVVQLTVRPGNIIPEPATISLVGLGLAGLIVRRLRAR